MDIYPPKEDSELLQIVVSEFACGKVLDMGTGSGIQALTAAKKENVSEVIAVDINPNAIKNMPADEKITAFQSDLYENLQDELFDTIICNPPYLPDEPSDNDPALYGGPKGFEWSVKFLKESKKHLKKGGQIIFLFSSLTNKERIDSTLKALDYRFENVKEMAMFFERLYVYRIWCNDV